MIRYIISETRKGNFIVQRPNGFGGLFPLIDDSKDCRNSLDCLDRIAADVIDDWSRGAHDNFEVIIRYANDPDNTFTN